MPRGLNSGISIRDLFNDDKARAAELERLRMENRPKLLRAMRLLALDMPIEQAEQHSTDIFLSAKQVEKCQQCIEKHKAEANCLCPVVTYEKETGNFNVAYKQCEYSLVKAREIKYERDLKEKVMLAPRFRDRTFDNFQPSETSLELLNYCKEWVENWRPDNTKGFYIYGRFGSGKTHLAVASLLAMREKYNVSGVFMVVPEFCDNLRAEFDKEDGDVQKKFNYYADASLLVIDDLGEGSKDKSGKLSPWVREKLFILINHRYEQNLTTIVTSVLSPEQLGNVIGGASVSRLMQMCDVLVNDDGDQRMQNMKWVYAERK